MMNSWFRIVMSFKSTVLEAFRLAGKESIRCSLIAIFGAIFVSGVEIGIAVFFQMFLKALGLVSEAAGAWQWLSDLSLSVIQLSVMLAIIGLMRGSTNVLVAQCIVISNESMVAGLRGRLFNALLCREEAIHVESSRLNFLISEVIPKMGLFWGNITQMISVIIMIFGVLCVMASSAPIHTMIGIIGLGCVGFLVLKINKFVMMASRQLPAEQLVLLNGAQRVGRNWLLIRILRTGLLEYHPLKNASERFYQATRRASLWTYVGSETPPTLGIALLILIIFVQLSFKLTPNSQFLVFLYLFMRFAQYIGSLARCLGTATMLLPTFQIGSDFFTNYDHGGVEKLIASKKDALEAISSEMVLSDTPDVPPKISMDQVSFSYIGCSDPVIADFSIDILPGEHLGIVGQSGSGKSTLLSLLLGVITPCHGRILIAGENPVDFFRLFSERVGYVGAEPFLFSGSIRDNLGYGFHGELSDEKCWVALKSALLEDVIRSKTGGLDYRINENSDGLSAGQKQRLALARALLRGPKLLILDEASANVDEQAESEIANVIARLKGKMTCILVSHRPGFLKHVDRIVRLGV